MHTSIYTSPNTKIVTNKSEGLLPPQQASINNASLSAVEEDDCDAMNIPCENAAVQPLHLEKPNPSAAQVLKMSDDDVDSNAINLDVQINHI